ncbi:DNA adenine methyltransferase YhdJ [Clostridium baratii str. Sullivan]|uniref:Methyltransferase n=1 Tax=Clostridium baratii str. Sullivan TaxID=1415775 RepID=A0A0A7FUJ2_9CLOT|nr:adenine-specific DNA-methyltransferase [Clostridium baratii]AIY82511.1 DNA adenine methyltransferase YhdJ [Clostridium baratii str. Sullivan]
MSSKIIVEDVIKGLEEIEEKSIDLIFIDPPYNLGKKYADNINDSWNSEKEYFEWVYTWLDIAISKLKKNGSLYIMNSVQNMPFIDIYLRDRLTILSRIVWSYDSSGVQAKNFYGCLYEPIIFAVKSKYNYTFNYNDILIETTTGSKRNLIDYRKNPPRPYNTHKVPGNVWEFPRVRYKMKEYIDHPSQKPEALLERIVKASSNPNDTVLDLFAGSFSMGMVCKRLNRNYIGIEKSKSYAKVGRSRLLKKEDED